MASTYTTNVGIEKLEVGQESGTWGGKTNINFDLIDEALNGIISVTLPSVGTSGAPNVLPITDGSSSNGRNAFIEFIDGGDLGGTAFVQLTPNDAEKIVYIRNSLSVSRSINIFQGTYNASNDYTLAAGKDIILKFNGGGAGATVTPVLNDLDIPALTAATADINGGTVDAVVGGTTPAAGTFTTLSGTTIGGITEANLVDKSASETITGAWTIGGTSAAAGTFTTLTATTYGGISQANLVNKAAVETISSAWTFSGGLTVTTSPIVAGTVAADFGAVTATSYGGITEANLVNKAAAETITGAWEFDGGTLGGTLDNEDTLVKATITTGGNTDNLLHRSIRTATGTSWETAGMRLQRKIDGVESSYVQFGGVGSSNHAIHLSYGTLIDGAGSNIKLSTRSTGIDVSGSIILDGTVDGRDVAADGTLLDTTNGWGDHSGAGYLTSEVNNLTAHTGAISSTTFVEAGRNSGGVAMTVNDGYGNANLTFNHKSGVPDFTGSSARIESSVDGTTGSMIFAVGDSTVISVAEDITTVFEMYEAQVNSTVAFTAEAGLTVTGSPIVAGTVAADFGAITGTSYGGITEANLVNKAAIETISSAWTFSGGLTVTTSPIVAGTVAADFGAVTATSYGGITEANLVGKNVSETVSGAWTFAGGLTVTTSPIVAGTVAADFGAVTATSYGGIGEGNLVNKNAAETIVSKWTFSNDITLGGAIIENEFTIPSSTTPELDAADGTLQLWQLTGNSTPTHVLASGESITLMILDGTAYTITWPTMKWIGGTAPTLSTGQRTVIELWASSTGLSGALVGITS